MEEQVTKERNSNIELLRIFSALAVIFLHINITCIPIANGINKICLYWVEALCIGAVDMFVLISGYFLCQTNKRKLKKVIEIILEVVCIKIFLYLFSFFIGQRDFLFLDFISRFIPNNYFVVFYVVLYYLSVFYNKCLNTLDNKQFKSLIIFSFVIFSVEPTVVDVVDEYTKIAGLSTITREGSMYGYNFMNFSLMYILGAYIRRFDQTEFKLNNLISYSLIFVFLIFIWSYYGYDNFKPVSTALSYSNPLIILNTVVVFLVFSKISFKSIAINKLSKAAFTCYLLQGAFLKYLPYNNYVNQDILLMVCILILWVFVIYLICFIAHLIWSLFFNYIFDCLFRISFIKKNFDKINKII